MEYKVSSKSNMLSYALIAAGLVSLIIGLIVHSGDGDLFKSRILGGLLSNSYFYFCIALGALFFLALNYATESGWYAYIKRPIEAVAGFLPVGMGFLVLALIIITALDGAHVYGWMDPHVQETDHLYQMKSFFLNEYFFWGRTIVYLVTYYIFLRGFRKRSLEEDKVGGTEIHFLNYRKGALFLVFFAVFSSTSAWDWIMSVDYHWFSTLFGWYTFAGMWVSTMVVLVMLVLHLKNKGYLPKVNDSHIHDLGKWTFAISFLWSYLWFSQFMLIWYANIPEEVTYYVARIQDHKFLYFFMFLINFAFPMLILMSRDAKRNAGILTFVGIIILLGHWLDAYQMVAVGSQGPNAYPGFIEAGFGLILAGLLIKVVLTNLTKAPLTPVNHPFLDESIHHEI